MPTNIRNTLQNAFQTIAQNNRNKRIIKNPTVSNPLVNSYDKYGFDADMVNYLNDQKRKSATDAGISWNYDPTTKMFTGNTMAGPQSISLLDMKNQVANSKNPQMLNQQNAPYEINNLGALATSKILPNSLLGGNFAPWNVISPTAQPTSLESQPFQYSAQQPLGFTSTMTPEMLSQAQTGMSQMGTVPGQMATPYNSGNPMGGYASQQTVQPYAMQNVGMTNPNMQVNTNDVGGIGNNPYNQTAQPTKTSQKTNSGSLF